MARLPEIAQRELLEAARLRSSTTATPHRQMSPKEYVEFATFAARLARGKKPVLFSGDRWRL